ncbi:hypothetical protein ACQ4PT_004319 [Festuca glaucescens]
MVSSARSSGGVAHSASNSAGSIGSPSGRAGPSKGAAAAAATTSASVSTPASGSTVARRLNDLEIQGDDAPSSQPAARSVKSAVVLLLKSSCPPLAFPGDCTLPSEHLISKSGKQDQLLILYMGTHADHRICCYDSKKKKKGTRVVGPDKGNRGLRQFSMKVCEKVEGKGRTTYNEVADELVAEFADPNSNIGSPDPDNPNAQQYDEKNIRRRVYDALNVLMAMDIISKDKKEIQWKGLPRTSLSDIDKFKTELIGLKGRIDKKSAYLQELQDQYVGLQNLVERNEQLYCSGDAPSGGVALPFILVQTRPHATVEVEISEDMQLVHFDFNSTPFELHDDSFVLKAMGFSGKEETDGTMALVANGVECSSTASIYGHQSPQPARPNGIRLRTSPPIPGILKGRVKHEY